METAIMSRPRKREAIPTDARTAYEVAIDAGGTRFIVGYTAWTGRRGLMNMVKAHSDLILMHIPDDEDPPVKIAGGGTRCVISFGEYAAIRFTGRTEREAAQAA